MSLLSLFKKSPEPEFVPTSVEGRIKIANDAPLRKDRSQDLGAAAGYYLASETQEEQQAWLRRLIRIRERSQILKVE
jgi:hypothetical protein